MALSWSEKEERKTRRISWFLFTGVSALFALVCGIIPLPDRSFAETTLETLMLETLDLSSFFDEIELADAADEVVPEELDEEDPLELSFDPEEPPDELLAEDVEALMAEAFETFSFSDLSIEDPQAQQNNREVVSLTDQDLVPFADPQDAFGSGLDLTQDLLDISNNASGSSRSLSSNLIGESFGTSRESGDGRRYTGNLEDLSFSDGSRRETIRATGGEEAPSLESSSNSGDRLDNLALGEGDISVPSDSLLQWIMANQAELDPGIRSLFYFAPPAISAKAQTTINAAPSEIQIMYTPSNREIRIALIRASDIYYFVDPGFQQRAQYFQKGVVDRDAMERIDFVESEDFSPTSPEARDFFRFFVSWWQQESQNM